MCYFEENATALMDLSNGGVDAVLVDFVVADYYITAMDADYVLLDETLAGEEYGIGFRKGDVAGAGAGRHAGRNRVQVVQPGYDHRWQVILCTFRGCRKRQPHLSYL